MDDFWQRARLVTSTSNVQCDPFTHFGGTCTGGVIQKWSSRILEQGMDSHSLGRWMECVRTHGKSRKVVLIVTAYQVCKASISIIGSKTAFAQQLHLLRQRGDNKPEPQ